MLMELEQKQQRLQELEANYSTLEFEINQEKDKLVELEKMQLELRSQQNDIWTNYKNLEFRISQLNSDVENSRSSVTRLREKYNNLQRKIKALDAIINSPIPSERFERRCVHGHLNCPNLPNDIENVANQSEIDDHIARVEKAERERADLQNELSRVEDELFFAERDYHDKSEELEELKQKYATTKDDLDNVSEKIRQNEREVEQAQTKLHELDSKKINLLEFIEQLKQQIFDLGGGNDINFDTFQSNNYENYLDDAEIERLALLQLQQEEIVSASNSTNTSSVFPQPGPLSDEEIEKMALRQLLEEENSSKINLNPAKFYNGLFEEVGEELSSLNTAAEKVSAGIQESKHFASSFFATANNLWPSAGQEGLLDTMYQAEIVAGMDPQATGDFLGDEALRNLKKQSSSGL